MRTKLSLISAATVAFLLAALALVAYDANACGGVTHITISHRASYWFENQEYPYYKDYLTQHQDAFQAGSAYPDWGYVPYKTCQALEPAGEATHWPPFVDFMSKWIHKKYPKPWDEDTEKLVAFLFGIESHDISDLLWHSLGGIDQGFIVASSEIAFNGSYSDAHENADMGGDVLVDYSFNTSFFSLAWYIPFDDMVAIYAELGYNVTWDDLFECTAILYLAQDLAERAASWMLLDKYGANSPFLVQDFQDYFVGGLGDMATWSSWKWKEVIQMLETGNGTVDTTTTAAEATESSSSLRSSMRDQHEHLISSSRGLMMRISDVESALKSSDIIVERTKRGAIFRKNLVKEKQLKEKQEQASNNNNNNDSGSKTIIKQADDAKNSGNGASVIFTSDAPFSYIGKALAKGDFNLDGIDDLVIGAPGYGVPGVPQAGAVYIVYGGGHLSGNVDVASVADVFLYGADFNGNTSSRFGAALAVVDINADGLDDLAVSAPNVGADQNEYIGRVLIFLGSKSGRMSTTPSIVIVGDEDKSSIGTTLASGDINSDGSADLIIGSQYSNSMMFNQDLPQRGLVTVFLSSSSTLYSSTHQRQQQQQLLELSNVHDSDWYYYGEAQYNWFGASVALVESPTPVAATPFKKYIVVGAPTAKSPQGAQAVGKLYGFAVSSTGTISASPSFIVRGDYEFDMLGQSFGVGNPYTTNNPNNFLIAISMPSRHVLTPIFGRQYNQAGTVVVLPFVALAAAAAATMDNETQISDLSSLFVASFIGNHDFSHLGWQVGFAALDSISSSSSSSSGGQEFYISSPWRINEATGEPDAGAVHVWNSAQFPTGDGGQVIIGNCDLSASVTLTPGEPKPQKSEFFGSTVLALDFNGDKENDLAVASIRDSSVRSQAGVVSLFMSSA